ncbi:alpha-2-macroglobulin [Myroides odoratimimus]|uniref:alpha-2-macroglobulin family protein n=1 Tax=Myroides odoratimimus TaxID=76832 RepID=UPI00370B170E
MKKLGLYLMILAPMIGFGQSSNGRIQELWNIIQKQEENAEVKSMLPNIQEVKKLSKRHNDYPSMIKAMFYEVRVNILVSEDDKYDVNTVIKQFAEERRNAKGINKAIIDTYIAEIFKLYYTANKYKLRGRTTLEQSTASGVAYWTAEEFKKEIEKYYQSGLSLAAKEQGESIGNWGDMFSSNVSNLGVNRTKLTVYDALRLNYLDNLQYNSFDLSDEERRTLEQKKEELKASLLKDVKAKNDPTLYVYVEMYLAATIESSEDRKEKFESLLAAYPNEPLVYEGYANYLNGVELVALIDKAVKLFPNTKTAENLSALKKYTERKQYTYNINKYVLDKQAIPVSIGHQNGDKVYVRVYKNNQAKRSNNVPFHKGIEAYNRLDKEYTSIDTYALQLSTFTDYEMHKTVVALHPLEAGRYFITFSNVPFDQIKEGESDVQVSLVNVTPNIIEINEGKLRAYNRRTGKPLSNISIHIANEDEKRTNSNYWETVITTDSNGEANLDFAKSDRYLYANIKGEEVYYSSYVYNRYQQEEKEDNVQYKATVLTDRGIYRPGQVLYFKSIVSKKSKLSEQVVAKAQVSIKLYDPNGKELTTQQLLTNEFGSVNGQFVLPSVGRLGNYSVEVILGEETVGWSHLSVEEYKRPKFEVEFEKPKEIYKLNEEVIVEGSAKAFLGANIDKAKVIYRVERQEIWPYWICGPYYPSRYLNPETMIQGETITDEKGKFTISFKALPKEEKESKLPRTFTYFVYADVIDQNGETHSSSIDVVVGEKNIELAVNLPFISTVKDLSKFTISTKNLNGIDYASQGELSIFPLLAPNPERISDNFGLDKGDYKLYDYNEFVSLFPHLDYGDEKDTAQWGIGNSVFSTSFNTADTKEVVFKGAKQLSSGAYIVKGYVYENGEKNEIEKRFTLRNEESKEPSKVLVELKAEDKVYKVGDKASVEIRSAENNTYAFVEVKANGKQVYQKVMKINKRGSSIDIPIKQDYKVVDVYALALKHNIAAQDAASVALKGEESKLSLVIESFRDKVEPGAKEKWSLRVKGKEKEQVVSEILATMYDASLDQFVSHSLNTTLKVPVHYYNRPSFSMYDFSNIKGISYFNSLASETVDYTKFIIDRPIVFNTYGLNFQPKVRIGSGTMRVRGMSKVSATSGDAMAENIVALKLSSQEEFKESAPMIESKDVSSGGNSVEKADAPAPTIRKNLQETAFFYPTLKTDENGDVKFEFTMPEALTKWKFMAFAHTKDLRSDYAEKEVVTQKELMVVPNLPRFLRQGDKLTLSTKVVNLSDTNRKGKATLQLFNAYTNELLVEKTGEFSVNKEESSAVNWDIEVPNSVDVVSCRIVAVSDNYSDGEESVLPVLTNRMLVTETMPIYIKEGQNKIFKFKEYEANRSNTLQNHKLTLELTTNPIWNAVFALPYLQEYPYDSSEQVFSKVFANAVATKILNDNPKIKTVFDQWNVKGEMSSKLEQNQELKSVLLAESPWVREATSEAEQMKRMAVLFDLNKMQYDLQSDIDKLIEQQNEDGGFSWFKGGKSDNYITQTIVEGFGNLKRIGAMDAPWASDVNYISMLRRAIEYMDQAQYKDYEEQVKFGVKGKVPSLGTHYLYARSYFIGDFGINEKYSPMITAIRQSIESEKPANNLYQEAIRAVIAKRFGSDKKAESIVKGIMETAVESDEMGMYWKNNTAGWLWYQAPIETQVAILEATNEVNKERYANAIEQMKVWLLKNKQTTGWRSTKATTKAVYALLNTGKSWLDAEQGLEVKVGGYLIDTEANAQAGSGYIKQSWSKAELTAKKGVVEVNKSSPGIAYGAMYWQYFEDLDAINAAETGIKLTKKLYIKANTEQGQVLREITKESPIKVGDVVTVRLEISTDRNMDYVHLKDMRASGFEPTNVLSGYRWKGELGYYEETRDASTNFFISRLRKGSYVFEYELRANVSGQFSNGITTMQSMYAPELSAHSEGIRVEIKN